MYFFNTKIIHMLLVYVFTPQSSELVYEKTCLIESTSSILAATFVPHLQEKRDPSFGEWQQKSQLFFLDSNQVCTKFIEIRFIYAIII